MVSRVAGGDDPKNFYVAGAPVHGHLRGLHTGGDRAPARIQAEAVQVAGQAAVLWSYADGRQVLRFRGGHRTS